MNNDLEIESDVAAAVIQGRKIEAIKLLRSHRGVGLKEAKKLIDDYSVSKGLDTDRSNGGSLASLLIVALLVFIAYVLYTSIVK